MDERSRTIIVVFLLCAIADMPAAGYTLDVCATCHANATCDDKADGSGKVCNCKYGFVGNGRTYCQDKDECQIGASKICGQHTTCHNTYGSYYCTCLKGFSPSNNLPVFIPNDGTNCQDINECKITGQCGEGGQCRNLEGTFECSCQLGYRVHNGAEPFHPDRHNASCKVVDCGQPASPEDTVLLPGTGTTYGSVARFECDEGFLWRSGDNTSVCGADGLWRGATMVCEEILCGDPPILPHTGQMWNSSSTPGSTVTYYCKIGFYQNEGNNRSLCTINGYWTEANISCKEVDCGAPPDISHSVLLWDQISKVGSQAVYQCNSGYRSVGERNVTVCTASGEWDEASLFCQEINCEEPVLKSHTKTLWDGTSHNGSVVYYQCDEGYHTRSLRNYSVCGENGLWEDIDLFCEEISCGPPLTLPHTNLLWDRTSRPGSVVLYECMEGFYQESGNGISTCLTSGEWGKVSVKCKAKCGPIPFLTNSEVVWHNRSVVIHRCVDGYHSWRGSNMSLCSSSGVWQNATLKCIEIKPPINHLFVSNEKCLHWRAEKYEENTEVYKVTYVGFRDYQRSFRDKRERFLSSKSDQLQVCLNLLPVTNYSISITAVSARFKATITTNTSLTVPPAPVVHYREFETPVPTLRLRRSPNTLDPISLYQVFVLPLEGIMVFDCSSPSSLFRKSESSIEYVTAQIHLRHVGTEMNFTVGDGLYYGSFYNAPLENGRNYYIILRAVSQWKRDLKSSCVLWAKVRGTSYVLKVSSLSATASVGLIALVVLGGYSCTWFFKKTRHSLLLMLCNFICQNGK
ncbi:sushi domain-containing protein 1 isoform X4 [Thunnus thynnus]|uniref:sushi domain-containing protein 1 isoform X4 n=1 Tax=Thunnus thynnus TaxID=8237 RepID=UPI00352712E0